MSDVAADPKVLAGWLPDRGARVAELLQGLNLPTATIPPKYFYDDLGSRLFAAITCLPEYYPPRCEQTILRTHLPAMVAAPGIVAPTWIDLGAGDCQKSAGLFAAVRPSRYVAVDIAEAFLAESLACLQRRHPDVRMLGVSTDFSTRLHLPAGVPAERRLFFYPGSSIGNFAPAAAVAFLRSVRDHSGADGALWLGVDLHKQKPVLEAAYDDALGVTAAFNRNVLLHVNRLVGTDFALADWRHVAFYAEAERRIEMHLEARRDLSVRWPGGERRFRAGERVLTEYSYKHEPAHLTELLAAAGWSTAGIWTDPDQQFAIAVAHAAHHP